jgi:hypothetical protein
LILYFDILIYLFTDFIHGLAAANQCTSADLGHYHYIAADAAFIFIPDFHIRHKLSILLFLQGPALQES